MAFTATPGSFTPINMWAMLRMLINQNTPLLNNPGPPVNGVTYAGQAGPGTLLIDFVSIPAALYINVGTLASPVWSRELSTFTGVQFLPFTNNALFAEFFNPAVIAAGSSQNTATPTTGAIILVTGGSGGITLPPAVGGLDITVINHSGGYIQVYGNASSGDLIDDLPFSTGVPQMPDSTVIYFSAKIPGQQGIYYTEGLASGFSRLTGLATQSFLATVVAAGNNQFTATPLTAMMNRISLVPLGAGAALPIATPGEFVLVNNRGLNPVRIYGNNARADTINGSITTTPFIIGVNQMYTFICSVLGNWETGFGAMPDAIISLTASGVIDPHTQHTYSIITPSVFIGTLAAPTPMVDDGIRLQFTSATPFQHAINTLGLLNTGTAAINSFTFPTFAGGALELMALAGRWQVMTQIAGTLS